MHTLHLIGLGKEAIWRFVAAVARPSQCIFCFYEYFILLSIKTCLLCLSYVSLSIGFADKQSHIRLLYVKQLITTLLLA